MLIGVLVVATSPIIASAEDVSTTKAEWAGGWDASLALDSNGFPVAAFTDATGSLRIMRCGSDTCDADSQTVKLVEGQFADPSLVLDSGDRPVIAVLEADVGLVVLRCEDPGCTTAFERNNVDPGAGPDWGPSLALDANSRPVIVNWDRIASKPHIIHCGDKVCSSDNTVTTPDTTTDTWRGSQLQLSSAGSPVVVYPNDASGELRLLRCGNVSCTAGNSIGSLGPVGNTGPISMQLASDDSPMLVMTTGTSRLELRVCADAACSSFTTTDLEPPDFLIGSTALALDPNDNPVLAYVDRAAQDLKILHCRDSICADRGSEHYQVGADYEGLGASLVLNADGFPVVAHRNVTLNQLQLLRCDDPNCAPDPVPVVGDANCDGAFNILDAYATAQYVVQLSVGVPTCADVTGLNQVSLAAVRADGRPVTILNAFWISECVVGLNNVLCPAD